MKRSYDGKPRKAKRAKTWRPKPTPRPTPKQSVVMPFQRTFYAGSWAFGTASTSEFWRYNSYTINQIPNIVEFSGLFGAYQITGIKVEFRPRANQVGSAGEAGNGTVSFPVPTAHVVIDPDSVTTPAGVYNAATLNSMLEIGNVRSYDLTKPFSVYFKPKCLTSLSGGSTGSGLMTSPWIRFTEQAVSHRGFHMFIHQNDFAAGANYLRLDQFVTFYFKCKSTR